MPSRYSTFGKAHVHLLSVLEFYSQKIVSHYRKRQNIRYENMNRMNVKEGLYVSYDEVKSGAFEDAVAISNNLGCVTWFHNSPIADARLKFLTDIYIKIKKEERYFQGTLLAVASFGQLPEGFAGAERNHRPVAWQQSEIECKSVLFISRLQSIAKPPELEALSPPQGHAYVSLGLPQQSEALS